MDAQNAQIRAASVVIGIEPKSTQITIGRISRVASAFVLSPSVTKRWCGFPALTRVGLRFCVEQVVPAWPCGRMEALWRSGRAKQPVRFLAAWAVSRLKSGTVGRN